ncbi:MAG: cyclohexa-1,5-dienecarbonyl-CoA hydratase [Calditrichaeota bacterium]|nr:MAG: cyclohexa-1,5-dienecarbonyl-CoA hydratase [Calditrichota bacterium]
MEKIQLTYDHEGAVAHIVLNAPRGNVLDRQMMTEIREVLESFWEQSHLKLIVFSGAGDHFSYGASVEEHRREEVSQMLTAFHSLFYFLMRLNIPLLAKISGFCLGGGLELALMCNFLFADKSARLGQPEITLGVFAPPASILLPLKIGYTRAEELLLTGKTISAAEAHELGLLNGVYDTREELDEAVEQFIIQHILPKSASSLQFAARAARSAFYDVLSKKLHELQQLYIEKLMQTHDANEGIQAFLEKRKPQWKDE